MVGSGVVAVAGTSPTGTKTKLEFLSAAIECDVVEDGADGSSLLVTASMEPTIGET